MNPLERPLRRLEHLMGARRDDRSLWAWTGPIATLVLTFAFLIFFGVATNIDLGLTIPMAVVMSVFLGTLSAFYLTAASADEHDADDDDGTRRAATPPTGGSGADVLREEPQRERVPVLDRHVPREEELVPVAGVDPHRPQ